MRTGFGRALAIALACSAGADGPAMADGGTCGTVVVPAGVGLADPAPVDSLHPVLASASVYQTQMMNLLYRPLIWSNAQHKIDWAQGLAQSVAVQDGGATYAVTLKPYRWSDGSAVTAADVLYWWRLMGELGKTYVYYGTGGVPQMIRDVVATGPHTLVVHLLRPVNSDWFEQSGLGQFYALPRQDWGALTLAQQQNRQSTTSFYRLSDGPFLLERLQLGQYAVLVPNPDYGGHRASLRRLVVEFLQGSDPLADLQAGQVDMATLPFTVWAAARKLPGFRAVPLGPISGFFSLIPNLRATGAPFLADVRVRQAMSMAISQKQIIEAVFHGNSLPDRGFVPTALADYLSPEIKDGQAPLHDDPAAARALLDAAGWRLGPDGVRERGGVRMEFDVLVTAGVAERLEMLQLIASDLAAVGMRLHIKELQFNQVIARMLGPPGSWDSVLIGWSMPGYPEGSQFFATGSTSNYEHYSNPEMDRLLQDAVDQPGIGGLFAVENLVLAQQPMIFLPDGFHDILVRPGITGVRAAIQPNGTWLPEYLTLSGAMACH